MFKTVIDWVLLYKSAEEPLKRIPLNKAISITVSGKKICLVHTPAGIKAIEDRCPHNGFQLSKGWCTADGTAVVCPLHRYAFDLETGRTRGGSGGAARVYPLEVRDDGMYIGFEHTVLKWFS
jgi:nitrite reductase/ring-hydroxylating ferredoxin subunit